MRPVIQAILVLGVISALSWADLGEARREPNLEKRADKAMDNAAAVMATLRDRYQSGDWKQVVAGLDELRESVELAHQSLKETGKDPRKSPKHFKREELRARDLVRRLESFSEAVSIDDRAPVTKVRDRVQEIHEELLLGIMSKKK